MTHDLETKNLQLVQALFDATGKGDWAAAESMLTSDFSVTEAGTLPFAGTFHGRGALQELFTRVMSAAGVTGIDMQQLTAGGDLPRERRQGLRDRPLLFRSAADYRRRRGTQARGEHLTARSVGKERLSVDRG